MMRRAARARTPAVAVLEPIFACCFVLSSWLGTRHFILRNGAMSESVGLLKRIVGWAKNQLVTDVPEDVALCEFDCTRGQCTLDEWATCERRLSHAAGELMPEKKPVLEKAAD
jgi:hypothetical protein